MRRIGNFLFVEQYFCDHEPEQAIVNTEFIECICANELHDKKQHTVITAGEAKIALTGNHNDNMIELATILSDFDWFNHDEEECC